jgi:hypothetical protein
MGSLYRADAYINFPILGIGPTPEPRRVESRFLHAAEDGSASKAPDGSWGPIKESYITNVLEVRMSESSNKLALDAQLWLELPETPLA